MRTTLLVLFFSVCGASCGGKQPPSSSSTPTAAPSGSTPAATADDPMSVAFDAATQWNMSMNGGPELSDADKEALQSKAIEHLKLACDAQQTCACNALKTGMCECPDEPNCIGEPFWFVGGQ